MRNPNGYGTVYKLSGRRRRPFTAVISTGLRPDGRIGRKNLGYYATRKDALAALSEYHSSPYDVAEKNAPLKEIWAGYIKYREGREKPVSGPLRAAFLKCEALHEKPFAEIRAVHIQGVVDSLKNTPATAARVKSLFGALYRYARIVDMPVEDAARYVETPVLPKSTIHKPFSADEIAELWDNAGDFVCRLALMYIYTGCRPVELSEMRRDNVHIEERYMVGGVKTRAGIDRQIPIAKNILPFVRRFMDTETDSEFLIVDRDGHRPPYRTLRTRWAASKQPVIMAHRMHDGRHTCESLLDNAGVRKRTIQLILGHAGRDVDEDVYTHKTIAQLIEAIDQI